LVGVSKALPRAHLVNFIEMEALKVTVSRL